MEAILDSKDLFEDVIVNDEPDFTKDKLEYDIWKKKNREAYSLIILSLSDDLTIIFRGDKRTKRIWYNIKKRFEGSLENKRIDLMLDLARLKLNPNENVNMYIVRAQKLAQEITQLGKTVTERELVRYIVEGLTPNFDTIAAALSINRGISLPDLRQPLLDFEKKRQDRSKNHENAFRSPGNQFEEKSCYVCKRKGHFKKDCWFNPNNKGNKNNTTNKNNMASTRNYHKGPKQNKDTARSAIQERTEEPSQRRDSTSEYALHVITRKNARRLRTHRAQDGGEKKHTSGGRRETNRICLIRINPGYCKLIGTGNVDGNMYTLNLSRLSETTHVPNEHCLISKDNSRTAWHRRLGHPSDNKLDLILKNNLLKGLDSINDSNQESYPFEAIYVDLCGPMRINSLGGSKYFLTIVDGFSRRIFVEFLKDKLSAAEVLKKFIVKRENELNSKLKRLRTDNGTEFINNNLETFIESKGIKHELTTPYTPRSNGRVERANRTLLDKGRTLLADSQLPLHFWAEAEDEQLDNHVLSDVDIEEPAPDTMINRQRESSESDRPQRTRTIPKSFDAYVLATTNETIPKDYEEAIACEDKKHWENAMLEEIQNMYSHQVWELVPRPVNAKVVKRKWVFKISKDQENKTYKARLVALGYNQIPGKDYNESFSPVIKNATLRTVLSMAATKDSTETKFANLTKVFTVYLNPEDRGMRNSVKYFMTVDWKKLISDPCLFKWKNEDKYFYVGIYVDDFITVSDSEDTSNRFINKLRHHLDIKDVTCEGMFLGINIIQDKEGISLQQSHYVQQILQKYGMETCKEVPTPGSKEINLDNHIEDDNCDQHTYQEALGMLMFLAVNTRPDIAYITSKLSQYSRQPKQMHWTAIKRVMRYLRGTIDLGVKFERGKAGILKSYTDASWSTTHDGKSYGGYVLKLGEATIDWKSSKQPLVALSTMEAEMIAACESCCQIKWIINLLRELEEWNFMEKPTAIYTDSQSLINWISSPKQSSRCKHINRKYHFLRDCYESRDICLQYKPSQDLEADIFTKDLSRDQMKKHLENLSIVGIKTNRGIIHKEFVPAGQTITEEYYLNFLKRLIVRIRRIRPEYRDEDSWCLLHDNAPSHSSLIVRRFLAKNNVSYVRGVALSAGDGVYSDLLVSRISIMIGFSYGVSNDLAYGSVFLKPFLKFHHSVVVVVSCPWSRSDQFMHPDPNTSQQRCLVHMDVLFWIDACHIEAESSFRVVVPCPWIRSDQICTLITIPANRGFHHLVKAKTSLQDDDVPIDDMTQSRSSRRKKKNAIVLRTVFQDIDAILGRNTSDPCQLEPRTKLLATRARFTSNKPPVKGDHLTIAFSSSPIDLDDWEMMLFPTVIVQPRTISYSDVQEIPRGESVWCFEKPHQSLQLLLEVTATPETMRKSSKIRGTSSN
ncbi:hypothetical protein LAZ67_8002127 [Cordylochernes scorpioides]|uniref:Uncharacterized protein n=1 Tax=Cordylochernes scorpioides TaxID=51811 RepID=A0ABY6KUE5_9ARAC|nr:hypothetical protein LAZ67_8002127 [Cordylochernes scorpioides]